MTRGAFDLLLEPLEEEIEVIDELDVDGDGAPDGGIGEGFGDSLPVHLSGDLLSELGEVVLGVGVLDVGEERRAAIFWESTLSFLTFAPWMAFM